MSRGVGVGVEVGVRVEGHLGEGLGGGEGGGVGRMLSVLPLLLSLGNQTRRCYEKQGGPRMGWSMGWGLRWGVGWGWERTICFYYVMFYT